MTTEEIFDELHYDGVELYGENWLWVNEIIIAICLHHNIDFRDKSKVIPFLQLVCKLKKLL